MRVGTTLGPGNLIRASFKDGEGTYWIQLDGSSISLEFLQREVWINDGGQELD